MTALEATKQILKRSRSRYTNDSREAIQRLRLPWQRQGTDTFCRGDEKDDACVVEYRQEQQKGIGRSKATPSKKFAASVTRTHDLQIGIRRIEVLLQSDDLPANLWPQLVENGYVILV